jgi:hypothetical protein
MRWVLGYTAALCVLTFLFAISIQIPTFHRPFYAHQYEKRGIAEAIRIEQHTLMEVTGHLLDYLRGRRPDLDLTAVVAGEWMSTIYSSLGLG